MIKRVCKWFGGSWKRFVIALLIGFAIALPYAEGALKNGWILVVLVPPIVFFVVCPDPPPWLKNLVLSLTTFCVTLPALDLALRPVLASRIHYTPFNMFTRKFPPLPVLGRWDPNVSFTSEGYGDLAAMLGDRLVREPRTILFQTDQAGFRNSSVGEAFDLLVLGDSFGAGGGTTQERIFAHLLQTQYGRQTYNLSYPGGPFSEVINFAIEWPRLAVRPRVAMLWCLYTGNDLDDLEGEPGSLEGLPWKEGFQAWLVKYRTFRGRSPLRQFLEGVRLRWKAEPGQVIRRSLPNGNPVLFLNIHELRARRTLEEVEEHKQFPALERALASMRILAEARQVQVIVLLIPTKGEVYRWILDQREPRPEDEAPSGFSTAVLRACARVVLQCLDTKPFLAAEARGLLDSTGELLWWRDDTHFNERGHEVMAAFIARKVLGLAVQTTGRPVSGNSAL